MNEDSFFEKLEKQYANNLPFVVYSRPINSIIKCWLQRDDHLNITTDFTESGFVFAPYDLSKTSVLLPSEKCEHEVLEIENLNVSILEQFNYHDESNKVAHINLVKKGIDAIKSGRLNKVVLSRTVLKTMDNVNPIDIFKRLFNMYKNAMVYCWYHPKIGLWLGATPELLFKTVGQQLTTISLAGTQPYLENKDAKWTNKEIEEQQIVTDYIIGQVSPYTDSITISETETIRAGSLLHLKSRITSRIKETTDLKSIIDALHPTPAVCGYPKENAQQFIYEHENYDRAFYTGFLGELNLNQTKSRNTNRRNIENNAYAVVKKISNFYVNLRCTQIKNNEAIIYVGGGITKDSNAENEWEETVNKSKTIVKVLN